MKSWKTTCFGLIGAIANALIPLLKDGTINAQTLIMSAAIAALGFCAKDFDVTGLPKDSSVIGDGKPPASGTLPGRV